MISSMQHSVIKPNIVMITLAKMVGVIFFKEHFGFMLYCSIFILGGRYELGKGNTSCIHEVQQH